MRPLLFMALLAVPACEMLDQAGHYLAGRAMACDASRWTSPELAVAYVMTVARSREELQGSGPGECGGSCQRDLDWWERGARDGAQCTDAEAPPDER